MQATPRQLRAMQSPKPSRRLPEFRALIEAARSYVAGNLHFSYVCTAVAAFNEAVKIYAVDPRVKQVAAEWLEMAGRVWPEWGQVHNPVTPGEFKEWVQVQLSVFDAEERND